MTNIRISIGLALAAVALQVHTGAAQEKSYIVHIKQGQLKLGSELLGYVQKGTLVTAVKERDGFVRVELPEVKMNRRRWDVVNDPVIGIPLLGTAVPLRGGWIDKDELRPLERVPGGDARPLHPLDRLIGSLVNSYNGGLKVHQPRELARQLNTDDLSEAFVDKQASTETQGMLRNLRGELTELKPGLRAAEAVWVASLEKDLTAIEELHQRRGLCEGRPGEPTEQGGGGRRRCRRGAGAEV